MPTPKMPAPILNFDGIRFPGVNCNCAPPDTNGEVGATQYVQIVNEGSRSSTRPPATRSSGRVSIESVWSGFGGVCEINGEGDPVVLYDQLANRWIVSQFAGNGGQPTDECVAVSTTSDATGSYNRYDFDLGRSGQLLRLPEARRVAGCVLHEHERVQRRPAPRSSARSRSRSIARRCSTAPRRRSSARACCGAVGRPAHAGRPRRDRTSRLRARRTRSRENRHEPDLEAAGASTSTSATRPTRRSPWPGTSIPAPFTSICRAAAACRRRARATRSTRLGDRQHVPKCLPPLRTATRRWSGNMTVESNGVAGVRWYEINNATSGSPGFVQQSTYQPDNTWRWMGSAAMDALGDIAVGFSASSSSINPQIRYAGRLAGDPPNTLAQGEATLFAGTGSQTGHGQPLGRLLRHHGRPERRLHVLVHDRSTTRRRARSTGRPGSGASSSRTASRRRTGRSRARSRTRATTTRSAGRR